MMLLAKKSTRRTGAVLLVVLAMLALFAIVGLSFVFYAESRATSSRIYREAQTINEPDTPEALQAALNAYAQLIYDAPDGRTGVFSGLRGHSLARAMYGLYHETSANLPPAGQDRFDNQVIQFNTNNVPYNGIGPVPEHVTAGGIPLVNFQWMSGQPLVDPERTGQRVNPTQFFAATSRYISKAVPSTYPDANDMAIAMVNPVNGQVLAPSLHRASVFNALFATLPNEYNRQQALSPPDSPAKQALGFGAGVDDWTTPQGRFRMIRPRPIDHGGAMSQFPYPPRNADYTVTGDVQNLPGSVYPYLRPDGTILTDAAGNPILIPKNDSIWIDIGAPVRIWNGKRIKPLFAFLVSPTNNKVNINASGNTRGATDGNTPQLIHSSGQGLHAGEINPMRVLRQNTATEVAEYERLKFFAYGANQTPYTGGIPTATGTSLPNPPGRTQLYTNYNATLPPSAYAPLDWDGGAPFGAMRMQLPGQQGIFGPSTAQVSLGNSAFALAPRWNGWLNTATGVGYTRYGNGDLGDEYLATPVAPVERSNSPYLWNPYLWRSNGTTGRVFTDSDMRKMHAKWTDDTGLSNDTALGQLAPLSFGTMRGIAGLSSAPGRSPSNAARFSITTRSNSLAIQNLMPMHVNLGNGTNTYTTTLPFTWTPGTPVPTGVGGTNGAGPFPDPATGGYGPSTAADVDYSQTNNAGGAGALPLIRGATSSLPPLDLNRPLADYRHRLAVAFSQNGRPIAMSPTNMTLPLNSAAAYSAWLQANGLTDAMGNPLPGIPAHGGSIVYNGTTVAVQSLMAQNAAEQQLSLFAAMRDRQELAKDIFARLVIATGAAGSYMKWNGYVQPLVPSVVPPGTTPNPQFDALRYLAQLSANIVDYIDGDDVATTFIWNPVNPNVPSNFDITGLMSPVGTPPATDNFSAVSIPDRLVMGTEKPKLVVNEAYGELANSYKDAMAPTATNPLELRFILELMNPNANDVLNGSETKPYSATTPAQTNPMQNAVLFYGAAQMTNPPGANFKYSTYLVDVHQNGAVNMQNMVLRNNVLGLPSTPPDLRVDFATINDAANPALSPTTALQSGYASTTLKSAGVFSPQQVGPLGMKYRPDIWTTAGSNPVNQGYLVLAPAETPQVSQEYTPVPWNAMAMPQPAYSYAAGSPFEYTTMVPRLPSAGPGLPAMNLTLEPTPGVVPQESDIQPLLDDIRNNRQPAVILRRLANPYLPPNDPTMGAAYNPANLMNPYIAVDRMENIAVNDGIRVGSDSNLPMAERPNKNGSQFPPPINERKAWSRMHPEVGNPNFMQLFTLPMPPTSTPHESFFRHNGQTATGDPETTTPPNTATAVRTAVPASGQMGSDPMLLMTPQGGGRAGFEWLVHLDRPLVNQLELLHVPATAPHQLTHQFAGGTPAAPRLHSHVAAWIDSALSSPVAPFSPVTVTGNQARLYRALELLKVKPWSYATPTGGRVPGKININMITDPNVLMALADPQSGDFFKGRGGSNPIPAAGNTDADPTVGYPFDAIYNPENYLDPTTTFGKLQLLRSGTNTPITSVQYNPATNTTVATPVPSATDKPFRSLGNAFTLAGTAPFAMPAKNGLAETALNGVFDLPGQPHPYAKQSLARKVYNNLTTTSECFEVYLTVGFFEVLNAGPYYTDTGVAATSWVTPILGKEVYKDSPGDLRARFFAVVDRTNLSIDPSNTSSLAGDPLRTRKQGAKPVFTELAGLVTPNVNTPLVATLQIHATGANATGPTISYDQTPDETMPFQIVASPNAALATFLKIGSGSNAEWVQVTGFSGTIGAGSNFGFDTNTGIATVTILRNTGVGIPATQIQIPYNAATLLPGQNASNALPQHPVGSLVTNVQLGNPGPQPNFDPSQPNYKAVMPYLQRLED